MSRLVQFLRKYTGAGRYLSEVEQGTQEQWDHFRDLVDDNDEWSKRIRALMFQNHVTPLVSSLFTRGRGA